MADLEFTLDANIDQLKKELQDARKQLADTALQANKLDSALKRSTPGMNQAGNALQNLGRVAQDAQFGFIGISNNLNPLLESFQRLKTESGSSKNALKALIGSLTGAGGVGLALSVVTAIIGFATSGFGAWTRGLTGNKAALDANKKAAKEAADAYKDIVDAVAREAASVSVTVEQLKNENLTRQQRSALIQQLQKDAPAYFATLDKEKATIGEITSAYNLYAASLSRIIEARAVEKQLDTVVARRVALQAESTKRTTENVQVSGKLQVAQNRVYDATVKTNKSLSDYQRFTKGAVALTEEETDELNNLINTEAILTKRLANIKPIDIKVDSDGKKVKHIETIAEILAKIEHSTKVLKESGDIFGINTAIKQVGVLTSGVDEILDKFKDSAERQRAIVFLTAQIDEISLRENLLKTVANIETNNLASIPLDITPPKASQLASTIKNVIAPISKELEAFRESVAELMTNIADSVAASFASLVTGTGGLQQALESVLGLVGQFLIDFGKGIIKAGLLAQAIKKIAAAPGAGIAVGIAAIVLGNILKSVSLPKGFATGGFVSGPGTAKSDSIPARLSNGEYVMSASTVSRFGKSFFDMINSGGRPRNGGFADGGPVGGIGGGQLITVEVVGRLRGKDIYFTNIRAGQTIGRNG